MIFVVGVICFIVGLAFGAEAEARWGKSSERGEEES